MNRQLMKVAGLTVLAKLSVLGIIFLGSFYFQFQDFYYHKNFICHPGETPGLINRFTTWDAQYYLFLAEKTYAEEPTSCGFFPLFPFLLRVFNFMFLNHTWITGLFVSGMLTVAAMVYLYRLTEKLYDAKTAWAAVVLLLAFPTSFFTGLIYSESVFLALAAAFFYYSEEKKTGPSLVCAFLLPFSRPCGILVLIPALVMMILTIRKEGFTLRKALVPLGFVIGFLGYLWLMKMETGNAFAAFTSQERFPGHNSIDNLFHPINWVISNFTKTDMMFNYFGNSLLNRAAFIGFLVMMAFAWRRLSQPLFIYALVMGLVAVFSSNLLGYIRYVCVVFPLFIFAALKLRDKTEYYLAFSLPLQAYFVLLYSLNFWVA